MDKAEQRGKELSFGENLMDTMMVARQGSFLL